MSIANESSTYAPRLTLPEPSSPVWYVLDRERAEVYVDRRERPFETDEDYVRSVAYALHATFLSQSLKADGWSGSTSYGAEGLMQRIEDTSQVAEVVGEVVEARRALETNGGLPPRLLRLAKRLGLSPGERRILEFVVVYASSPVSGVAQGLLDASLADLIARLRLSERSVLEFACTPSILVREGVLEVDRGSFGRVPLRWELTISGAAVSAFWGLELTQEEFASVEGTPIAELLREEPGFLLDQGPPKPGAPALGDDGSTPGDAATDADDPTPFSIDRFIGRETSRPAVREGEATGAIPPSEGRSQESDGLGDGTGYRAEAGRDAEREPPNRGGEQREADTERVARYQPYWSDFEYLQDQFKRIAKMVELHDHVHDDLALNLDGESERAKTRRLKAELRQLERLCELRLAATRAHGEWLPRVEQSAEAGEWSPFERNEVLYLLALRAEPHVIGKAGGLASPDVGSLLTLFSDGLEERVRNRAYFYKTARLVRDGVLEVESLLGNLDSANVSLDPRMHDFFLGIEANEAHLVEGSQLYAPTVRPEQCVLPEDVKQLVLGTVNNYEVFQEARERLDLDSAFPHGKGMVLLFYGPPGVGKTMMANAIAHHLGKRVLLVNFPSLGARSDAVLRFLFREARIQNAVLFFDECEGIFGSGGLGGRDPLLLTEIERHEGLVILATNRPQQLDEAMHRRIKLAVPFRKPDPELRERIWRMHIPEKARLADDVDLCYLAHRLELTGGLIKNAVGTAFAAAVGRDPDDIVLTLEDLESAARHQLRGHLQLSDFDRKIVPESGLDSLVVPGRLRERLETLVAQERENRVLFSRWGFDDPALRYRRGQAALFYGLPGTGKSKAAEAVAFELGRPLRRVTPQDVLSKFVGEGPKLLEHLFRESAEHDAILFFDDADGLFAKRTSVGSSTDRYANVDVGVLLEEVERFPGLIIVTSNLVENLDPAFRRRFAYALEFERPSAPLRERLWAHLVPAKLPLGDEIDFAALARIPLAGGGIQNAILRAASAAAMRGGEDRAVQMEDFLTAAREEAEWEGSERPVGFSV